MRFSTKASGFVNVPSPPPRAPAPILPHVTDRRGRAIEGCVRVTDFATCRRGGGTAHLHHRDGRQHPLLPVSGQPRRLRCPAVPPPRRLRCPPGSCLPGPSETAQRSNKPSASLASPPCVRSAGLNGWRGAGSQVQAWAIPHTASGAGA